MKTRTCIPVRTAERRAFAKCATLGLPCWWLRWLVPVAGVGSGHVHARGPGARDGLPATAPRPGIGIGRATAVPASPAAAPAAGPVESPSGPACPLPAAAGAASAMGAMGAMGATGPAAGRALRYGRGFESRHCGDLPADPRPAPGAPRYGAGPGARGRRDESPGSRPQP